MGAGGGHLSGVPLGGDKSSRDAAECVCASFLVLFLWRGDTTHLSTSRPLSRYLVERVLDAQLGRHVRHERLKDLVAVLAHLSVERVEHGVGDRVLGGVGLLERRFGQRRAHGIVHVPSGPCGGDDEVMMR